MKRITAKEARELAGSTTEEKVEKLLNRIEELAKQKKRQLRAGYDYALDNDFWINKAYLRDKDWLNAKKILEDLGYIVSFYYAEHQLVDMYTLVEW